jgi:molecular chaperone GrpE
MNTTDDNKKSIHNPEEETLPETTHDHATEKQQEEHVPQEINYKDLFIRTNADLQNFKRRVERERIDFTAIIQTDVLEKILPTVDELEIAIQTALQKAPAGSESWIEGFQLMLKNLKKRLSELGVEEIDTTGIFNPEYHEALMQVDSPAHKSGYIVQQLSRGYMLKGKVIRHARVSVAK